MIGRPLRRREDERALRGQTRYLDDIELDGVAHVAFVRSPHPHALIGAVRAPAGVELVTAGDLTVQPFPVGAAPGVRVAPEPHPVLAGDEVRYVGQPVALVIAASRALAEDAAELVEVDYEVLPPVVDPRDSGFELLRFSHASGDVDAAFGAAAHIVGGRYSVPRLAAVPIEPRGCMAEYDERSDLLTVWCSAQDPHRPLAQLAHILRRAAETIRVIIPDVGGAFGSKGVIAPEVAAVAAAAIELRRPLKWIEDRRESLLAAYQGRAIEGELELALDADGRMLGLRARLLADLGGYLLTTTAVPAHTAATLITGCYDIPAASVTAVGVCTHKPPTGPYRGAGRPEAAYLLERLVDKSARALGLDRVALRRPNLIRSFPHRTATGLEYDSGDYERCLDLAVSLLDAAGVAPASSDCVRGSAVALLIERAGGLWESAEVEVLGDGRVLVRSSSSPHGQGHETTFAQIAASRLGLGVEDVVLEFGGPPGMGTYGSRSVATAGSAVALAVDKLIDAAGRQRPFPVGLKFSARFESGLVFSSGAYGALVEISRTTGRLSVLRLAAVDDAGTVINPLLAHGQVVGGAVQGLGECLTEEVVFSEDGRPLTASLFGYTLLSAADVPPIVTGEVCSPSPLNPLGAKGIGEGGAIGTLAAVSCAVDDALGGVHVDPPFTSEKLWRALSGPRERA
jgi:carbon-monoxide dehydrogenase large subunit